MGEDDITSMTADPEHLDGTERDTTEPVPPTDWAGRTPDVNHDRERVDGEGC